MNWAEKTLRKVFKFAAGPFTLWGEHPSRRVRILTVPIGILWLFSIGIVTIITVCLPLMIVTLFIEGVWDNPTTPSTPEGRTYRQFFDNADVFEQATPGTPEFDTSRAQHFEDMKTLRVLWGCEKPPDKPLT